ncbi:MULTISPECIES: hypothetical protein [Cupriavidus]
MKIYRLIEVSILLICLGASLSDYAIENDSIILKAGTALSFVIAFIFLFWWIIRSNRERTKFSATFRLIFWAFMFVSLMAIARAIRPEMKTLTDILFIGTNGLALISPFWVFVGSSVPAAGRVVRLLPRIYLVGIALVVYFYITRSADDFSTEFVNRNFLFPVGFVMLLWRVIPRYLLGMTAAGLVAFIFNAASMGKRYLLGIALAFTLVFIFSVIFNKGSLKFGRKRILAAFLVVGMLSCSMLLLSQYDEYGDGAVSAAINRVAEKGLNNSRDGLVDEFLDDLSPEEKILGRGVLGAYTSKIVLTAEERGGRGVTNLRRNIEIGYLQIILKGGLLLLILFLVVSLQALGRIIGKRNNSLVFAAGCVVGIKLMEMFIFGLPSCNGDYVLFWICVGICRNPAIGRMTDDQIAQLLKIDNSWVASSPFNYPLAPFQKGKL